MVDGCVVALCDDIVMCIGSRLFDRVPLDDIAGHPDLDLLTELLQSHIAILVDLRLYKARIRILGNDEGHIAIFASELLTARRAARVHEKRTRLDGPGLIQRILE